MQFLLGSPGLELGDETQHCVSVIPLGQRSAAVTAVRQLPRGVVLRPFPAQEMGVAVSMLPWAGHVRPLAQDRADQRW